MESLFTRLYKYRQRDNKSDLENFSTELLAYCLETDMTFQDSFLKLINYSSEPVKHVSTQASYSKFGRPDIEILTENNIILIENKVESLEGHHQLDRYVEILQHSNSLNKYLVYLTKYYECKAINDKTIKFSNIKWWDINKLINNENTVTTIKFSEYLTENELAMDKDFKNIDLVSLENITNAISKMDEVIDSIKDYFSKRLGNFSKDSSRSTRLNKQAYYNYKSIGDPLKFNIDVGYFWWWANEPIYLGVRIHIPYKSNEKAHIIDYFKKNLTEWGEPEEWGKTITFGNYIKLNEVISQENSQLRFMVEFLQKSIDTIYNLKQTEPQIFE